MLWRRCRRFRLHWKSYMYVCVCVCVYVGLRWGFAQYETILYYGNLMVSLQLTILLVRFSSLPPKPRPASNERGIRNWTWTSFSFENVTSFYPGVERVIMGTTDGIGWRLHTRCPSRSNLLSRVGQKPSASHYRAGWNCDTCAITAATPRYDKKARSIFNLQKSNLEAVKVFQHFGQSCSWVVHQMFGIYNSLKQILNKRNCNVVPRDNKIKFTSSVTRLQLNKN